MAKFRRAHYIAIAHLLGDRYRIAAEMKWDTEALATIRLIAADFISAFSVDSGSFDAQKFAEVFKARAGIA